MDDFSLAVDWSPSKHILVGFVLVETAPKLAQPLSVWIVRQSCWLH